MKQKEVKNTNELKPKKGKVVQKSLKAMLKMYVLIAIISVAVFACQSLSQNENKIKNYIAAQKLNMTYEEAGDNNTQSEYVKFNAYFQQKQGNTIKNYSGVALELNERKELYIELNVIQDGYLENGKIVLEEGNYNIANSIAQDKVVRSYSHEMMDDDQYKTIIDLNNVQKGTYYSIEPLLEQNVQIYDYVYFKRLSNINSITFTGTHVSETDGTRTKIEKTINFTLDWYGSKNLDGISATNTTYVANKENQKLIVGVQTELWSQQYNDQIIQVPDKEAVITANLPLLNGYAPENVTVTDISTPTKTVIPNYYNKNTRKLEIRQEIKYNDEQRVYTAMLGRHYKASISIEYPYEAYETLGASTKSLNITFNGYLEGYNNPKSEFINPVKSKTGSSTVNINLNNPSGDLIIYETQIDVLTKSKLRLKYDRNKETDNGYRTTWNAKVNYVGNIENLVFEEDNDKTEAQQLLKTEHTQKTNGQYYDLEGIVSYAGIKIPESSLKMLGEDGYVEVINEETGEVVKKITLNDANKYITYDEEVKHIKIQTSKIKNIGKFVIYNHKKIDNEAFVKKYPNKAEFNDMELIHTALNGSIIMTNGSKAFINRDIDTKKYTDGSNMMYVLPTKQLNTQKLNNDYTSILLVSDGNYIDGKDYTEWVDPTLILEYPEEVEKINIKEIKSYDGELELKEVSQKVESNGKKTVKIKMQGVTYEGSEISISQTIKMNSSTKKSTGQMRVFSYNELCDEWKYVYNNTKEEVDIYDINENGLYTEVRNIGITELIYSKPTGIFTTTESLNYDSNGSSVMGPDIAVVEKQNEAFEATIRLNVYNNYNTAVNNAKIVGKIPFKGNTYQIMQNQMGSTFNTTMKSPGIILPDSIKRKAKVYYSTQENVTDDITDETNKWVLSSNLTEDDWKNIKTYLIHFDNVVMNSGDSYVIDYKVELPANLSYGNVAYATHAIYFDETSAAGTTRRSTETDKVGLKVDTTRSYNLHIRKTQKYSDKQVVGVKYKITGTGLNENGVIFTTNADGKITINDLYPEEIYTLEEIYAPEEYIKAEEIVKIETYLENGELKARILQGETKKVPTVEKVNESVSNVYVEIENQAKYNLSLTKYRKLTEQNTNETGNNSQNETEKVTVPKVRFNVKGKGLNENGKIVETDSNGKITINNLYPEEIYTLQEISAPADYIVNTEAIEFKVVDNNGSLEMQPVTGAFKENAVVNNETRIVEVSLENETGYTVEVIKLKQGTNKVISGVQFTIKEKDSDNILNTVTTNNEGIAIFGGLVPQKSYIIQETKTTDEYILNETPITFTTTNTNGDIEFILEEGNVKEHSVEQVTKDKVANIKLYVENEPKYDVEITKYKKNTQTIIQGVKFKLKGEGLPEEGTIYVTNSNGKISISNLTYEKEYSLEEIAVNNSYVLNSEPIVFKASRENTQTTPEVVNGTVKLIDVEQEVNEGANNKKAIVKLEIENEPKYELNIEKYKTGTNEKVSGVTFNIKGEGMPEGGKTYTTNSSGNIKITGLVPEQEYTIQETKTNSNYMLNENQITFKTYRDEEGTLKIEKILGEVKNINVVDSKEGIMPQATIEIENEPKYNVEITKYEAGKENTIPNVQFIVKGKGMPETGKTYTTNSNGKAIITKLEQGEVYTIQETYAKGYYVDETEFTVKVEREGENLKLEYNGREAKTQPILTQNENELPKVEISLENVNIPKYKLELTKIGEKTGKELEGAEFEITGAGRDFKSEKEYVTNENGILTIENLYENEEYTLTEVLPPIGYKLSETPIKFKATQTDGNWTFEEIKEEGAVSGFKEEPIVERETVKVKWEDELLFKLEKIDEETRKPLPGAKYKVEELNEDISIKGPAKDVAGNEVGTLENIDGIEMKVLTTDENGIATTELAPGLYQATEVKAPKGYKLPEEKVQYFGINKAMTEEKGIEFVEAKKIETNGSNGVTCTSDGGYIKLEKNKITKYGEDDIEIWSDTIDTTTYGGYTDDYTTITGVQETKDGGYIAKVKDAVYYENEWNGRPTLIGYSTLFCKYDQLGGIVYKLRLTKGSYPTNAFNDTYSYGAKIIETSDGQNLLIENSSTAINLYINGISSSIDAPEKENVGLLVKFTDEGDIIWKERYENVTIGIVKEDDKEGFIIGGSFKAERR